MADSAPRVKPSQNPTRQWLVVSAWEHSAQTCAPWVAFGDLYRSENVVEAWNHPAQRSALRERSQWSQALRKLEQLSSARGLSVDAGVVEDDPFCRLRETAVDELACSV